MLQKYRERALDLKSIAAELHAARAYVIAVRLEAQGFRVTGFMLDPASGRKLGVYDGSALPLQTPQLRLAAAKQLAAAVISFH